MIAKTWEKQSTARTCSSFDRARGCSGKTFAKSTMVSWSVLNAAKPPPWKTNEHTVQKDTYAYTHREKHNRSRKKYVTSMFEMKRANTNNTCFFLRQSIHQQTEHACALNASLISAGIESLHPSDHLKYRSFTALWHWSQTLLTLDLWSWVAWPP